MSAPTIRVLFIIRKFFIMKNKFIAKNFWGWLRNAFMHIWRLIYAPIKTNFVLNVKWRINNRHNHTSITNFCDLNKINVWNYTQWPLDIRTSWANNSYVRIWSYCSIAPEVEFLCLSNHPLDWLSTHGLSGYMIPSKNERLSNFIRKRWNLTEDEQLFLRNKLKQKEEMTCHWPIIVDDDVRIWTWAKIMSWVHVWQWAVIAAWAVVTKDIPPYAIAWWVPAKVIKYRFSEDKIKKLLQIDYSNIPIEKFREIYPETIKEDFDIDYILEKLKE